MLWPGLASKWVVIKLSKQFLLLVLDHSCCFCRRKSKNWSDTVDICVRTFEPESKQRDVEKYENGIGNDMVEGPLSSLWPVDVITAVCGYWRA